MTSHFTGMCTSDRFHCDIALGKSLGSCLVHFQHWIYLMQTGAQLGHTGFKAHDD